MIANSKAQYKGTGTVNNQGSYTFMLSAIDGQSRGGIGEDKFRIKITDQTTQTLIYDNQPSAPDTSDPATIITSGQIVIHR